MIELVFMDICEDVKVVFIEWLDFRNDGEVFKVVSVKVVELLEKLVCDCIDEKVKELVKVIKDRKDYLVKRF